ncbi:uncharacterized protein I206_100104 [Kwoniella pini CBS 10737]|uniref:Zn(2)-C6 fungal-type domain-containing protein n=1 Tax=Kwoniella pini CBS 10737 TaxID=1296096 RepID=A0A1B9IED2_9TREE|nr:uncharacterized protein I206_01223 [Kwoniella pini CBS 10737]OCF53916.1 hypothetical protein I206_01223 [Kwoniella pini CBS 10737]
MVENPIRSGPSVIRAPRSRLDRPCDLCRRLKQLCSIEVRGEPCMACRVRSKPCTFDMPPTIRKRRKTDTSSEVGREQMGDTISASHQQVSQSTNILDIHERDPTLSIELSSMRDDGDSRQIPWSSSSVLHHDLPPSSLDMEESHNEESHFIGADAFSTLVVRATDPSTTSQSPGGLSFRQVSSDMRFPVYFVKTPALLYGRTPHNGKAAFEENRKLGEERCNNCLERAITSVKQYTLKAIPVISTNRLDNAYSEISSTASTTPHALLAGIIAHSTHYLPELRSIHKELWSNALLALDDEFRQPRLSTLQLALLQMYGRPVEIAENAGQLTIASGRAIGAAFLLGLHIDPTNWSLPLWERKLRKRIWWALVIQDKWRALLYGRPSFLHKGSYNVPLLSVEDGDFGEDATTSDKVSMQTFIAISRLTLLIDDIIDNFQLSPDIQIGQPDTPISRIAQLEIAIEKVQEINQAYAPFFETSKDSRGQYETSPTGVQSFKLSSLGLIILIRRLLLRNIPDTSNTKVQSLTAMMDALGTCREMAFFVESLTPQDEQQYWTHCSFHHIFNNVSLLLYIVTRARSISTQITNDATELTITFISNLIAKYRRSNWDVISAALRRAAVLLMCIKQDLPEFSQSYFDVATALNLPTFVTDLSVDDFLTSLGIDVPAAWSQMVDDQSWLSSVGFNNESGM